MRSYNEGGDSQESRGGFGQRRNFAPVKVGDEVTVKIESIGEKGDGIAKIKGFIIFVPGVKEGQELKVRVTRVLNKCGFGEVVGEASAPAASGEKPKDVVCDDEKGICTPKEGSDGEGDDGDDSDDDSDEESGEEAGEDTENW